jgi:hypothetical protein
VNKASFLYTWYNLKTTATLPTTWLALRNIGTETSIPLVMSWERSGYKSSKDIGFGAIIKLSTTSRVLRGELYLSFLVLSRGFTLTCLFSSILTS